jgi:hypothetical protein
MLYGNSRDKSRFFIPHGTPFAIILLAKTFAGQGTVSLRVRNFLKERGFTRTGFLSSVTTRG